MQDVVVDISHFNGLHLDFVKAKAAGLQLMIHKATQSIRYVDPMYAVNRKAAKDAGLLTGAYHFGSGSASGKEQADFFLQNAVNGDLLCLDFEPNPQNVTMGINQALEFCEHVEQVTETPIMVYTGAPMLPQALKLQKSTIAGKDRALWWAEYNRTPHHAPKEWSLTLWQYTDHGELDGIGHCDRSEFYGTDLNDLFLKP